MLKISEAVEKQVRATEVTHEALRLGVLNYSAFAKQVLPSVAEDCCKSVSLGTIVVALSRLHNKIMTESALRPVVGIENLSVHTPLCDLSFEKSAQSLTRLLNLHQSLGNAAHDFFTLTQGVSEITVICSQKYQTLIRSELKFPPKSVFSLLTGITLQFNESLLTVPNAMFTLMGVLAPLRINLLEIISTYTELSLIINPDDAQRAVSAFTAMMQH